MLLTLKWMDNRQQIENYQRFCDLFSIFNLTCCKCVALKERTLTYLFQAYSSGFSLWGDQGFPLSQGLGGTPPSSKNFKPPPIFLITLPPPFPKKKLTPPSPLLITEHILKKCISNSFQTNFTKNFPCGTHMQLHNHDLFEKFVRTKFLNTKQCLAGFSPRILLPISPPPSPLIPKTPLSFDVAFVAPIRCGLCRPYRRSLLKALQSTSPPPPPLPLSTERGTTFSPTFRKERSESATNFCIRDFLSVLCTHFLQNVIQENIEIIYFDWCMITITKNFVVYIFSSCMQASVYFGECEFSVKLFLMN